MSEKKMPEGDQRQIFVNKLLGVVGRLQDAIQDKKNPESMIPAKQELASLIEELERLGEIISDEIKDFTK